jgi:predicted PurR-regulated permease PerM
VNPPRPRPARRAAQAAPGSWAEAVRAATSGSGFPTLRGKIFWAATFVVVGVALIWVLRPVFAVLAASAGLAYLLDPFADWLEQHRLSREAAIGVIFTVIALVTAVFLLLMVPGFVREADEIRSQLVPALQNIETTVQPLLVRFSELTGREVQFELDDLKQQAPVWVAEQWPNLQDRASQVVSGLFTQGLGLLNAVLNITLMPIFVFYLLRDWDRMMAGLNDLIPPTLRPRVERVATEVDQRLSAFVRGQITVSAIMAVLYSIGLLVVGIDLAVPVGVLSGLLFVVPYLGTAVGIVLGVVLALLKFGLGVEVLMVLAVFAGVQFVEGYLLTPRIVGDSVGLHPLVVMVALIVGGSLMGIWGMLLAIPITAVLSVFAAEWLTMYRSSRVYQHGTES